MEIESSDGYGAELNSSLFIFSFSLNPRENLSIEWI